MNSIVINSVGSSPQLNLDLIPRIEGLSANSKAILTFAGKELNQYLVEKELPLTAESVLSFLGGLKGSPSYNNSRKWAIKRLLREHATSVEHLRLVDSLFKIKVETGTTKLDTSVIRPTLFASASP